MRSTSTGVFGAQLLEGADTARTAPVACKICGLVWANLADLRVHQQETHSNDQPYQCQVCNKRFFWSGSLSRHMRIHNGQRPYQCSVCTKCFTQSGTLQRHIRTHTGEKPYECRLCPREFSTNSNRAKHMKAAHSATAGGCALDHDDGAELSMSTIVPVAAVWTTSNLKMPAGNAVSEHDFRIGPGSPFRPPARHACGGGRVHRPETRRDDRSPGQEVFLDEDEDAMAAVHLLENLCRSRSPPQDERSSVKPPHVYISPGSSASCSDRQERDSIMFAKRRESIGLDVSHRSAFVECSQRGRPRPNRALIHSDYQRRDLISVQAHVLFNLHSLTPITRSGLRAVVNLFIVK